jgi:hypothetical protein
MEDKIMTNQTHHIENLSSSDSVQRTDLILTSDFCLPTTPKKQNEPKVGEASPLRYHSPRPEGTTSFWLLQKTKRTQTQRTCRVEVERRRMYKRTQF